MPMLRINDAARELDCSPSTLRRLEAAGTFRPQRDRSGARRYDAAALEAARRALYPEIALAETAPAERGTAHGEA